MSPGNLGVFQLLEEVTFRRILVFYNSQKSGHFGMPCHCSTASVSGSFARHSSAFSGLQSIELSMILETLEYISLLVRGFSLTGR